MLKSKFYYLSRKWSIKKFKESSKLIDWPFLIFQVFIRGYKQMFFLSKKNLIFRSVEFSHLSSFLIFSAYSSLAPWAKKLVVISNLIDQKYPLQHSGNLFCHPQLLIHHMQAIWHKNPYHINLIIKTELKMKIRTTTQIHMTSTHV